MKDIIILSQGISVSIVTGYGLDDWGSIPCRGNNFSPRYSVQTGSQVDLISWLTGTGHELITSFHSVTKLRVFELFLLFPLRLHGVVLNEAQGKIDLICSHYMKY
jgi:hypothetical protein